MDCLKSYRNATCYSSPSICVCCACARVKVEINKITIHAKLQIPSFLRKLYITNPFLIQRSSEIFPFEFKSELESLNGMILCRQGLKYQK